LPVSSVESQDVPSTTAYHLLPELQGFHFLPWSFVTLAVRIASAMASRGICAS
jgi:hypothetical protein